MISTAVLLTPLANDGQRAGRRIVLPASFTGGARFMHKLFQDAMAIVRRYGKPHIFVTCTSNVQWPEIQSTLFAGQTASDRPDIVCRVFRLKLNELLHEIVVKQIFGAVLGYVYTIEFQNRGLPHVHLLFILRGRQRNWQDVDDLVSAEIPDSKQNQRLFGMAVFVIRMVVHVPVIFLSRLSKAFAWATTAIRITEYRRRSPADGGQTMQKYQKGVPYVIDNRWVVPYNRYLIDAF